MIVLGWDIGGSNTKVCRVENGRVVTALSRPFEVKEAPDQLSKLLQQLAAEVVGGVSIGAHAVTMTAELSRNFLTKRQGVAHVLDAVRVAFAAPVPIAVFTVRGEFLSIDDARADAIAVASANWMATALLVAAAFPDALLIDVGSTTADIIPIVAGRVVAVGRTDPDRLASRELLYTGALRTPVEALAAEVCVQGRHYALAAEAFATTADVHAWRGDLAQPERTAAGHRLARALCADRELMDDACVTALADALARAQIDRVAGAIAHVAARHPAIRRAVVAGAGSFIAARAALAAGLEVCDLADAGGEAASRCAPAAAVALLLAERMGVRVVVKVGGSLLAHETDLAAVLDEVDDSSHTLIVPGGGPFADAVRGRYARGEVNDDEAHWMAVAAMDRYAELLAARLSRGCVVRSAAEAIEAAMSGRVPVLAPSQWMRDADSLPHTWDVTSDSIAAWIAGQVHVPRLILIKPPGAIGTLVDPYFERARPAGADLHVVPADQIERLRDLLQIDGKTKRDFATT